MLLPAALLFGSDDGISGSVRDRAGFEAALADCHHGDTLVVIALDRLGRDLGNLVEIVDGLGKRGVNFDLASRVD